MQGNTANLQPVACSDDAAGDFGNPPSGEVPILFNDHHVYSKPDRLKENRVLAALVRGNEILVPLRSMFEQMGATVSYDPASKTADVSKPGSDVKVTVGKPEVVINGESRPLDVPPEIYKGSVVVPIRVISEGMGAYVQWVPDKKVVVVRYVAAPCSNPAADAGADGAADAATAAAAADARSAASAAAGNAGADARTTEPRVRALHRRRLHLQAEGVQPVLERHRTRRRWVRHMRAARRSSSRSSTCRSWLKATREQYAYTHPGGATPPNRNCVTNGLAGNPACVTPIGGVGSLWVPQFQAIDGDASVRAGVQIANPRIYVAGAYLWTENNYGYPRLTGAGFGVEKLPDLDKPFSVFGSAYYFPTVQGNFTDPTSGIAYNVQDRFLQYQAGVNWNTPFTFSKDSGVFIEAGFMGNNTNNKQFLPGNGHEAGAFAGIGVHF